jgi:hypothetical protein
LKRPNNSPFGEKTSPSIPIFLTALRSDFTYRESGLHIFADLLHPFAIAMAMCIMGILRTIQREIVRMERRLHTRHRARTTVYVVMSGRKSRICKAKNLSANGVFVETENLGLRKGQQVQLAFAINLGLVTKIHRRTAIVAHVTRGGTGLMMEQFAGR